MGDNNGPEMQDHLLAAVAAAKFRADNLHARMSAFIIQQSEFNTEQQTHLCGTTEKVIELGTVVAATFPKLLDQRQKVEALTTQVTTATANLQNRFHTSTIEELVVDCPRHQDQKITLHVKKNVYTNANGPSVLYACPLTLSKNCIAGSLLNDQNWKSHIKQTCLPKMLCINPSPPNPPIGKCGPA